MDRTMAKIDNIVLNGSSVVWAESKWTAFIWIFHWIMTFFILFFLFFFVPRMPVERSLFKIYFADTVFNIQSITVNISSILCIFKLFETNAKLQMNINACPIEMCDLNSKFGFIHFQTMHAHNDKLPKSLFIMSWCIKHRIMCCIS